MSYVTLSEEKFIFSMTKVFFLNVHSSIKKIRVFYEVFLVCYIRRPQKDRIKKTKKYNFKQIKDQRQSAIKNMRRF